MMEDNVFENYYGQMIPEDGIPLFGFRLVAFYDDEGGLTFRATIDQEVKVPLSTVVGLLELAKHEIMLNNTLSGLKHKRDE